MMGAGWAACPTKEHWRDPAPLWLVESKIAAIGLCCDSIRVESVAVPPLGCGLEWLGRPPVGLLLEAAAWRWQLMRWLLYDLGKGGR